jgi:hypothetical protein
MILISGLVISDICIGAIAQPLNVVFLQTMQMKGTYRIYCISGLLSQTTAVSLSGVSGVTLLFISIDRLLAIKMKTKYKTLVTIKRAIIALSMLWCMCFIIGIVLLSNGQIISVFMTLAIIGVAISLIIIVVNLLAFQYLRKISFESTATTESTRSPMNIKTFKGTLWTIIMILALYAIFYIPYIAHSILFLFNPVLTSPKQTAFYNITVFFVSLNSLANPFLYICRMKQIREAVKTSITCIQRQNNTVSHIEREIR